MNCQQQKFKPFRLNRRASHKQPILPRPLHQSRELSPIHEIAGLSKSGLRSGYPVEPTEKNTKTGGCNSGARRQIIFPDVKIEVIPNYQPNDGCNNDRRSPHFPTLLSKARRFLYCSSK